jgi:hypothetical protein
MTSRPALPTLGAFAYFENDPATYGAIAHAVVDAVLESATIPLAELKMSLYRMPRKEGRYRNFKWKSFDEAVVDPAVQVLNVIIGSTDDDVWFHTKLQLRTNPDPHLKPDRPRQFSFVCEARGESSAGLAEAARRMLAASARDARPLFGGCFRGQSFLQANCEIDYPANYDQEPKEFKERIRIDRKYASDRWTKARRLYPITLLGPKLASQVTLDRRLPDRCRDLGPGVPQGDGGAAETALAAYDPESRRCDWARPQASQAIAVLRMRSRTSLIDDAATPDYRFAPSPPDLAASCGSATTPAPTNSST